MSGGLTAHLGRRISVRYLRFQSWLNKLRLTWIRMFTGRKNQTIVNFGKWRFEITDWPNFFTMSKDLFVRRIYHFGAERPDPLIIDGGSNIGMSIFYFKQIYPAARIIGFEPDPAICQMLRRNLDRNGLNDVQVVEAGLSNETRQVSFEVDGSAGGKVEESGLSGTNTTRLDVQVHHLSQYLHEPVDFLKLNIEGEELPALQEAADKGLLRNVREMVVEYHGWPTGEQRLGAILSLLEQQGFRYLVHDFDPETCRASKPPFSLDPNTTWFCLIYAGRQPQAESVI